MNNKSQAIDYLKRFCRENNTREKLTEAIRNDYTLGEKLLTPFIIEWVADSIINDG